MDNKTRVHTIYNKHGWHIYWNLFLPVYKRWGVKHYWSPFIKNHTIAFYFGYGEFVLDFNSIKKD
jgi:hypothetical protein